MITTSLKGVSSMKIHRELGIPQVSAWHMMHRIRQAFIDASDDDEQMGGPVEAHEFYVGGVKKWKHAKNKTGKAARRARRRLSA